MADGKIIRKGVLKLFPKQARKRTGEVLDAIAQRIGGYIIAQFITMASVGLIMTLGLFLMGSEYALLLGLLTGILDIIPIVGPTIALLICLIVLYKSGTVFLLMTCVVFAVAQLVENNFVRPYVFGKFLDLHPLIIYLFILISAKHFGIIGVIFAPAIAATIVVLIEELYVKSLEN